MQTNKGFARQMALITEFWKGPVRLPCMLCELLNREDNTCPFTDSGPDGTNVCLVENYEKWLPVENETDLRIGKVQLNSNVYVKAKLAPSNNLLKIINEIDSVFDGLSAQMIGRRNLLDPENPGEEPVEPEPIEDPPVETGKTRKQPGVSCDFECDDCEMIKPGDPDWVE